MCYGSPVDFENQIYTSDAKFIWDLGYESDVRLD